jgi:gluconolactonase
VALLSLALAACLAGLHRVAAAEAPVALDLTRAADLAVVSGEWRVKEAALVPVEFRRAGADGQPGGEAAASFDVEPRAGWASYDDGAWPVVDPARLADRRGTGKVGFVWFTLRLTLPDSIGGVTVDGRDVVVSVSVDDAAEVWVDGELRRCPGQEGGTMLAGWNAVNRVVVARGARAGQRIRLAIFGVNGPLSASPTNYVWLRSARLELLAGDGGAPRALPPGCEESLAVHRFAGEGGRLDAILPPNPKLFLLADGFTFTEGPVWDPARQALLFSEPNANRIWRWRAGKLDLFRDRSGYRGSDVARYRQPGSNGLAIDPAGRLTIDQHGNRRVVRLEPDGGETVLADRDRGRRLNSPNDLVFRRDGTLYFTDPFFGLPGLGADPAKEVPYQGVYRVAKGRVELLTRELAGPNGIAFSPDERFLYVGDWDDRHKAVVRFPVRDDGRLGRGETFADLTAEPGEDAIDGVKTDTNGNVYVSGPGGLWIFAADGARLARLETPRHVHNLAWGEDGTVLYLAARDHLYRLPTRARGFAPHLDAARGGESRSDGAP